MSKNTGTSELINYFDLGVNGDVGIAGSLDINTIANATTDTDTFLVSDTGIIKYRTGAQLLSDIGAQGLLTNPVTGTGTTNYLPKFTGSTTIGNSQIFDNGTNVGINTNTPLSTNLLGALTIVKSYSSDTPASTTAQTYYTNQSGLFLFGRNSGLTIVGANNEENQIIFANTSTVAFASINTGTGSNSTGGDMYFKVGSNTEAMRIFATTRNVHIGPTPVSDNGARLQVSGNISAGNISAVTNTIGTVDIGFSGAGYATLGYNIAYTSTANTYQFKVTDTSWMLDLGNANLFRVRYATGTAGNTISYSNLLTIASTGAATFTGDVSITKDNPKLILNDNAGGSQNNYSISSNFGFFNINDETASGVSVMSYGGGLFNFTGAATFSSSVTANNYVASGGSNTTVFNSTSATTGWVQIAMNNTSGSALLGIEGTTAGTLATGSIAYASVLRNYTDTAFQIATNNIVRATITSSGNVGIGTTSPQSPIDVISPTNGYVSFGRDISVGQWTGIHFGYREDNTLYRKSAIVFERTGGAAQGNIHFLNNNAADTTSASLSDSRMVITSGGNVLIGTTTDNGAALQVQGIINGSTFSASETLTVNANNEKKCGMYRWNDASTNLPEPGYFSVIIYGNGDNVTAQMATHFQNANTYVRAFNTSWTAWRRII